MQKRTCNFEEMLYNIPNDSFPGFCIKHGEVVVFLFGGIVLQKRTFYTEIAFFVGLVLLAFGTAMTALGGFGMSSVVAPAYIVHLKVSEYWSFFSFGVAEYALQATILGLMLILLRRVRLRYFLSILTAVVYGFVLDGAMAVLGLLPMEHWGLRLGMYAVGAVVCALGISLLLRSYLPPEVYELLVKEVSEKWNKPVPRVKTVYDCASLVVAVALSFLLFGKLQGIGVGTFVCALLNGVMIRLFGMLWDKLFDFKDIPTLREKFIDKEV